MPIESKITIKSGAELAYKFVGDPSKPTIIFANGAVFNYRQFEPVYLPKLQNLVGNKCSFLLYDYVGYGQSSDLKGDFDFEVMTKQQVELMDALEIDQAHLFGLSKGSLVSHLVTANFPERVLSIGAYGSPNPANEESREPVKEYYQRRLEEVKVMKDRYDEHITEENFDEVYDKIYIPSMMEREKEDLNIIQRFSVWFMKLKLKPLILGPQIGMMDKLFSYFLSDIDEETKMEYKSQMKNIDQPVLHMHGKMDPYIPHSSTELLSEWVPKSRLKLFSRYMHNRPTLISWQGGDIMKNYAYFLKKIVQI